MKHKHALITALLLSSAPCIAAGPASECRTLTDDVARLACYDAQYPPNPVLFDPVEAAPEDELPVERRARRERALDGNRFALLPHRPNYILPATYNATSDFDLYGERVSDGFTDTEVKFQVSLKGIVADHLWRDSTVSVAYTQQSFWQLYADDELSSPFRETNYEPEIIWSIPQEWELFGFEAKQLRLGFNHQSNGRSEPLSRSWNRFIGGIVMERGRLVLSAQGWLRADDPSREDDDNPDIQEYMGRAQLGAAYALGSHVLSMRAKTNLRKDHRGGVELNWTFPLTHNFRGFVQVYTGHGENLADMENSNTRVGIGVALNDWL